MRCSERIDAALMFVFAERRYAAADAAPQPSFKIVCHAERRICATKSDDAP